MATAAAHRSLLLVLALIAGAIVLFDLLGYPGVDTLPTWAQTLVGVGAFVALGAVVAVYTHAKRRLVRELSQLASRDRVTGIPNTRAFEAAIERRLERAEPFALVLGDVDELRRLNITGKEHGDEALRRLAERLLTTRRADDDVARVGGDEFAVLSSAPGGARDFALLLERQLDDVTFGWASYPGDGETALALYRAADERLYARKMARGFRR